MAEWALHLLRALHIATVCWTLRAVRFGSVHMQYMAPTSTAKTPLLPRVSRGSGCGRGSARQRQAPGSRAVVVAVQSPNISTGQWLKEEERLGFRNGECNVGKTEPVPCFDPFFKKIGKKEDKLYVTQFPVETVPVRIFF